MLELWCWRRLLRVPWTARRSNQSILKISPGCSLEGLILKLKLQYFGHLRQRADSFEKTLMLGKIEGRRRRWWQRMRWLDGIIKRESEQTLGDSEGQGSLVCCSPWGHKESDMTEGLNNNWCVYVAGKSVAVEDGYVLGLRWVPGMATCGFLASYRKGLKGKPK